MIGNVASVVFLLSAVLIACTLAAEQTENRLFEPSQFADLDYDLFGPFEQLSEPAKRIPYTSPFVRFGKRGGGLERSLRNGGPMIDPLIRFGKRSDKRLSSSPFIRFGRSYRHGAPHIRFGK